MGNSAYIKCMTTIMVDKCMTTISV